MQMDEGTQATRGERSRIDHRTGKRVRIYDASFWEVQVAERSKLGQSVRTYCMARGLALSTFRRWAQRLEGGANSPQRKPGKANVSFLKIPLGNAQGEAAGDAVEVGLGSAVRVKLSGAGAQQVLAAVLARVEGAGRS